MLQEKILKMASVVYTYRIIGEVRQVEGTKTWKNSGMHLRGEIYDLHYALSIGMFKTWLS
jgi:hypothetical protein